MGYNTINDFGWGGSLEFDDYYQLLGVSRFASQDVLKRAFRSRVLAIHPDQNPDDYQASEETRKIVEAYKVLSNPQSKSHYDMTLDARVCSVMVYDNSERSPFYSMPTSRVLMVLMFIAFFVYAAFVLVSAYIGNGSSVYRPLLLESTFNAEPAIFATIVEPNMSDCVEWYHARSYQMSFASRWATCEIMKLYSDDARRASERGDFRSARFYRASMKFVKYSQPVGFVYCN